MNHADKHLTAEQCTQLITKWESLAVELMGKAAKSTDVQTTRRLKSMILDAQKVAGRYRRAYKEKVSGEQPA